MIKAPQIPQQQTPPTGLTQMTQMRPKTPMRSRLKRLAYGRLVGLWRRLPGRLARLALRLRMARVSVGVCALAQDGHGRLLVAHHTYRRYPWGLPGGLVGRGEQPDAALARELREELGVEASIGPLIHAETWPRGQHLTLYYSATLLGTPEVDGIEIDNFRYVTLDETRILLGPAADRWLAALTGRRAS
jgi:8-oxo-dGTP pyrophosphatase MutT (NUDIX family)